MQRSRLRGNEGAVYVVELSFYLLHYSPANVWLQFVAGMLSMLSDLDKEAESASSAWFGGGMGDRSEHRHALRNFLSGFVETVFVPTLVMDSKCAIPLIPLQHSI